MAAADPPAGAVHPNVNPLEVILDEAKAVGMAGQVIALLDNGAVVLYAGAPVHKEL